jgi:Na+/proline symporter
MILAVVLSIIFISNDLHLSIGHLVSKIWNSSMSDIIITDWHSRQHYIKQFFSGMFITIVMTGLDQEMMQKNLSCRNLKESQKNMFTFSFTLIFVNLIFLFLGAVLILYAQTKAIDVNLTDDLFPTIAMKYLSPVAGLIFLIGLISAAYPSADGALTSLTTSFCIDFLNLNKRESLTEKQKINIRYMVHLSIALLFLFVIVIFRSLNNEAVIDKLFTIAGYTYGPLLGFYSFGLFTKYQVKDAWVPVVAIASPILCYVLNVYSKELLWGYKFGFELLILNGFFTFIGLLILSKKRDESLTV